MGDGIHWAVVDTHPFYTILFGHQQQGTSPGGRRGTYQAGLQAFVDEFLDLLSIHRAVVVSIDSDRAMVTCIDALRCAQVLA